MKKKSGLVELIDFESSADWKFKKLSTICRIIPGSTPSTDNQNYWNGDIIWITPTDLGKLDSIYITNSARKISEEGYKNCSVQMVPENSIILSTRAPIGHLGIAKVPLCTNQGCKSFLPNEDINTLYVYYLLKYVVPELQEIGSGSTFKEISKKQLEEYKVPVPSLPEQERIVSILQEKFSQTKRLREALQEQLLLVNSLSQSILSAAFKGEL